MPRSTEERRLGLRPADPVLIVDDDRGCADLLARGLRRWQIAAACRYDGATALEAICATDPPVVLLDIGLPDIPGTEVAAEALARGLNPCLILMSGYDERILGACDTGIAFFRVLHKPLPIRFLAPFVGECVSRVRAARVRAAAARRSAV